MAEPAHESSVRRKRRSWLSQNEEVGRESPPWRPKKAYRKEEEAARRNVHKA
jgi:hypothetical protein